MNQLPIEKRAQIINLLVEGNSLRATSRITGTSINTVTKLLVDTGKACQKFHNDNVNFLQSKRVECDEIWSFVYAKERHASPELKETKGAGDIWTWTAIDADSKLIISWLVSDRSTESAKMFIEDLASRLSQRIQLTTDAFGAYRPAVDESFGSSIDFGQIIKIYAAGSTGYTKSGPAPCIGSKKDVVVGNPDFKKISTSYVERQNLNMRMSIKRFARLTNAFSKKVENHTYAVALHFMYYNFVRVHKTLRVTPAMEAGLTKKPMTIEEIVRLV